jgi:hypothetical protein
MSARRRSFEKTEGTQQPEQAAVRTSLLDEVPNKWDELSRVPTLEDVARLDEPVTTKTAAKTRN